MDRNRQDQMLALKSAMTRNKKRIFVGLATTLVALYIILPRLQMSRVEEGLLFHPKGSVDLGSLLIGQVNNQEVSISNRSSVPVNIINAVASCSCTRINLSDKTIKAGAATKMKISSAGVLPIGVRLVKILVDWRFEGKNAMHRSVLSVSATTVSSMIFAQDYIDFGAIEDRGTSAVHEVKVNVGNSGKKWNGVKLISPSNLVKSAFIQQLEGGLLRFSISNEAVASGQFREQVEVIPTNDNQELEEKRTILIVAERKKHFWLAPHMVNVGNIKTGTAAKFKTIITSEDNPIRTVSLLDDPTSNLVLDSNSRTSNKVEVDGSAVTPLNTGAFVKKIRLTINDDAKNTVEFVIMGYVI